MNDTERECTREWIHAAMRYTQAEAARAQREHARWWADWMDLNQNRDNGGMAESG